MQVKTINWGGSAPRKERPQYGRRQPGVGPAEEADLRIVVELQRQRRAEQLYQPCFASMRTCVGRGPSDECSPVQTNVHRMASHRCGAPGIWGTRSRRLTMRSTGTDRLAMCCLNSLFCDSNAGFSMGHESY